MVSSIDGATAVAGRSGGLSNPTDVELLAALRAAADVVLVGAGTVRAERYGAPRRNGLRIAVVTRTGRVDADSPLFTSGAGILVAPEDAALVPEAEHLPCIRAGIGEVDLGRALALLEADSVHVEGGPALNGHLFAADLVDEVNLTVSPLVVAGSADRIAFGGTETLRSFTLDQLVEHEGVLYVRWLRSRS
jgi:riboflavin biosynthesis pyrimidine reductase